MIAVPREDGGVAVHGSLQCPYYIHKAMKRAFRFNDAQAQVVQAETGGGFGGKEEYPSIIALHAALLARKSGKPVRMIYDRHEDLSATTKRHPAIVTHRTGVKVDGTITAQEIEIVMDGGAYCTLTPVVLSRGAIHAGGPYRCENVRIRARATRTNTPPNGAFRGFGAPQVEFAAEIQVDRLAEALGMSPIEIRRRNLYREGDTTPTGQVLRESVAASEVLERAAEAAEFEGVRSRTARDRARRTGSGSLPAAPLRTGRDRVGIGHRDRARLARRGVHRLGRGQARVGRVGRAGRRRRRPGPHRARPRWARGRRRSSRSSSRRSWASPYEDVEIAPQDTAIVPDSGPTVASRTAMVVGGLLIKAARRLRAEVEERNGGRPFADVYRSDSVLHGHTRVDQQFEPYPGVEFDDATYRGDAYPAFGWAACVASVDVDLDSGEVTVRDVVAADDVGHVIHPVLAEGQVEGGTLQAIGYATVEEIKLPDGRYLNDRLATYIIPTALDAPRITSILVEAPFSGAPHGAKGSASCRWTSARRRSSPRSTMRPASGSTICPRRRSGSSRRWARPATWPGRLGSAAAVGRAWTRRSMRRSATEPTPRPTRRPTRSRSAGPAPTTAASTTAGTTRDGLPLPRQRRAHRGRRAGHAAAARRAARGPRADRDEGGLRGRASAAPARSCSTTRSSIPASSRSARSTALWSGPSRVSRPAPSGARASTRCSRRSSTRAAPSAGSARRGC